jgi:hypothetical protein
MKPRLLSLGALLAATACSETPGGPAYTDIGLRTLDRSSQELDRACWPLPVLPGGVVAETRSLAPGLTAHVKNDRDSAEVTLDGTDDPASAHVKVPQGDLVTGYTKTLDVTTIGGDSYSVLVFGPCNPPKVPTANPQGG